MLFQESIIYQFRNINWTVQKKSSPESREKSVFLPAEPSLPPSGWSQHWTTKARDGVLHCMGDERNTKTNAQIQIHNWKNTNTKQTLFSTLDGPIAECYIGRCDKAVCGAIFLGIFNVFFTILLDLNF